jgi:hypothetical protein
MVEEIVVCHIPHDSGFRSRLVLLISVFYSHMEYYMYPITSIIQLTTLFGTSCGGDRLDCVAPRQTITLTLGLGVTGRHKIPEGVEKPCVRMIESCKSPFLERHQGRGFTDMRKPKANLGTISDASCMRTGKFHRAAVYR